MKRTVFGAMLMVFGALMFVTATTLFAVSAQGNDEYAASSAAVTETAKTESKVYAGNYYLNGDTEKDLIRMLDNQFMQVELDFIYLETKNTLKEEYYEKYYVSFNKIKKENYDGFIVTGAPLEHLNYADIFYIEELKEFLKYTKNHVKSTLCILSIRQDTFIYNFFSEQLMEKS